VKYTIKFLPLSVTDLEDIKEYLSQYYESTVANFFNLLKEKISRLKNFPHSCPKYEDAPDYRRLVVGDYLVFYKVNEDEKSIEIHRILHGSQQIQNRLGNIW